MRIQLSLALAAITVAGFSQATEQVGQRFNTIGNAGQYLQNGIGSGVSAQAATLVYDNSGASGFSTTSTPANFMLDDATLGSGFTKFNQINFGFVVNAGLAASFSVDVLFYDTCNYNATPMESGFLNGFTLNYTAVAAGAYTTGMIDFSSLFTIVVPDGNLGVDFRYRNQSQQTLSTRVTQFFYGGGVSLGSSLDTYSRDVNGNGTHDGPGEARTFGGAPNLANFYMQLAYVPEPSTYAAIATGLVGLLGLRRRK